MKKIVIISALWGVSLLNVFSQSTEGNNNTWIPTQTRYLGFNATQPANTFLQFRTNNIIRMALNGNRNTAVNGQPALDRDGYLGLGRNLGSANNWNDVLGNPSGGPLSLLHLNGYESNTMGTGGFRNWMQSGITFTANNDLMYVGPRRNGSNNDVTDAMFVWGDNAQTGSLGPDNLLFAFTAGFGDNTVPGADLDGTAPNGREIMRLTATGNVGMGPRFSNAAQPQSQLHINGENAVSTWFQLSNQTGTGMLAADGFRAGVNNVGNTYLYNQENAPMIFSTNASTVSQLARERMRLTHVGAPGVPVTAATGTTRVAVSVDPAFPLTEPRSLMHIGGRLSGQAGSTDGVRDWMNVGYLATFGTDNIYVGMKDEGQDRQDAVIAWGDNQTDLVNGSGPDNLRFIFANSQFSLSPGTPDAKSDNGQEIGRFTPACATCPVNTGSLGIGNYSPGSPNGPGTPGYVGATLDVNGDARIRTVTQKDELKQILVRDPNDLGRIYWRDGSTLTANFGAQCGNAASATLTQNTEVPLGGFNLIFSGQDTTADRVGIGIPGCGPNAKLDVLQTQGNNEITINAVNTAPISGSFSFWQGGIAVRGHIETGDNLSCEALSIGGAFTSNSQARNIGVLGVSYAEPESGICTNVENFGGYFWATNSQAINNIGIHAEAPTTGSNMAAFIEGNGTITGGFWQTSDIQLKQNVNPIQNASDRLLQLNAVNYDFISNAVINLPEENQNGFIAQEMATVFPELVKQVRIPRPLNIPGIGNQPMMAGGQQMDEFSAVNYIGLIPVLVAAFQEQNERINQLQSQLQACCTASDIRSAEYENQTGAVVPVRLHTEDAPRLGQNIPNPFDVQTRIPVYLPVSVAKAEIIFYSNEGKIIQNQLLFDRGEFSVAADAETLASGIYSYTLYVDGKPVETKRMVKR